MPRGFDVAAGDLVITSDTPLAAEVIEKGGHGLSPRGEMHSTESIRARLNMRDFLDTMRSSGVEMGRGPAAFNPRDKQTFANELDRFLTRYLGRSIPVTGVWLSGLSRGYAMLPESPSRSLNACFSASPLPSTTP